MIEELSEVMILKEFQNEQTSQQLDKEIPVLEHILLQKKIRIQFHHAPQILHLKEPIEEDNLKFFQI